MRWSWMGCLLVAGCDGLGAGDGGGDTGTFNGVCSTGQTWSGEEGATMQPGGDCISCHSQGEGPDFTVAGTVMNDYGDGQGCYGVSGVTVRITDANGTVHPLTTNATGNFFTSEPVPTPYSVELEVEGTTRAMAEQQVTGDCASCHTADGQNGAPGRVLAP